jgi:hypothetical protein
VEWARGDRIKDNIGGDVIGKAQSQLQPRSADHAGFAAPDTVPRSRSTVGSTVDKDKVQWVRRVAFGDGIYDVPTDLELPKMTLVAVTIKRCARP